MSTAPRPAFAVAPCPEGNDRGGPRAAAADVVATAGLSVVIPVYNSEPTLPTLIERLDRLRPQFPNGFEVILVNDGSRDRSWETICGLSRTRPWVSGIDLLRNYGQENALLCGIREAAHDVTVLIDDDLQ